MKEGLRERENTKGTGKRKDEKLRMRRNEVDSKDEKKRSTQKRRGRAGQWGRHRRSSFATRKY